MTITRPNCLDCGVRKSPSNTYVYRGLFRARCNSCWAIWMARYRKIKPQVVTPEKTRRYQDTRRFEGLREQAIQRDGGRCVRCAMTRAQHKLIYNRDITVDHIDGLGRNSAVPRNELSNLQTLCLPCHGKKDGARQLGVKRPKRVHVGSLK
jgi:5-methylcytosine-specific restriction endonuclease McrA